MRRLLKPLWILLALLFLFEAWLWSHLAPIVHGIVGLIPWRQFKERASIWIERLPPAATLLVFVVPAVLLFPVKVAGLWLLAQGHWLTAMTILVVAKIIGTGLTAFIFDLTRPKLLQLAWFRWLYDHVVVWLAWAHQLVDPIKEQVRAWTRETLKPLRRRIRMLFWLLRPQRGGRFVRRLVRIRRRMQQVA